MRELKIEYVPISSLKPYENNAKIHTDEQIRQIENSIEEFGFNDPIGIAEDGTIIEGHGRYLACLNLGMETVPVIRLDGLTEEQRRAYTLVHNELTLNSRFDLDMLNSELDSLTLDMEQFGFQVSNINIEDLYLEDENVSRDENSTQQSIKCPQCGYEIDI